MSEHEPEDPPPESPDDPPQAQLEDPTAPPDLATRIRGLAMTGATDSEICDFLTISPAQLAPFGTVLKQRRAARAISIRKKQTDVALEGNTTLLTFLGKHELGQADRTTDQPLERSEPQLDPKMG
jgi:hypothetical protein